MEFGWGGEPDIPFTWETLATVAVTVMTHDLAQGVLTGVLMSNTHTPDQQVLSCVNAPWLQAGFEVAASTQPGEPEIVIGQAMLKEGIDLLIMGAYTHSTPAQTVLWQQDRCFVALITSWAGQRGWRKVRAIRDLNQTL